jgi:diaminopimelate decarboxylase
MPLSTEIEKSIVDLVRSQHADITTPAYIYAIEQVEDNYKKLKANLDTPVIISIKANHCPELLSRAACFFEDGYEVASLGELRLRAGTKQRILVNTPAYDEKFIEVASRYKATFIIDHVEQFNLIAKVQKKRNIENDVLLRLNLDAISKGPDAKPEDHFGMDEANLQQAIKKAASLGIKVSGLHIFCGSNNFLKKSNSCIQAIENVYDQVSKSLGYALEFVNLGGGIPANWQELDIDFAAYRKAILPLKNKTTVVHEAGRAIFGSAGYFLTEVISTKSINQQNYLVCDGGMAQNFLLAKTEHVIRKLDAPIIINEINDDTITNYKLVGASCNRDDVIGELKSFEGTIKIGHRALFKNCGAYNALYTVNKFLALKEFKEYII